MSERPIAIVPARGGSKRFPRKNIAELAGKPLLAWTIDAALRSEVFEAIGVSSEDAEILDVARQWGAVPLPREERLAGDDAQVRHVVRRLLEAPDGIAAGRESFAVLLPTSPLRTVEDICRAYELFRATNADVVMSLAPFAHPPQRAVWAPEGRVLPYFGPQYMVQTQRLDQLYRHDGSIILGKTEAFLRDGEFYGSEVVPFYADPNAAVDIDSPLDLEWAEFLLVKRRAAAGAAL